MFVCFCLRSIKTFKTKIKLIFLRKICHFLKKKKLCKVNIFLIHRLASTKAYQKNKEKVKVVI
jgi:hypothetical protein